MDPRQLLLFLEHPYAAFDPSVAEPGEVMLAGLTSPSEYWVGLAVTWAEQGAPVDEEIARTLEAVSRKPFSQRVRHRSFALAVRWRKQVKNPDRPVHALPLDSSEVNSARLLLIVEDSFQITGRGRVLAPGLPGTNDLGVRRGHAVHLVRPDGQVATTVIQDIEAVHLRRLEQPRMVVMITLPASIGADDVPAGTRVLLSTGEGTFSP